MHHDTHVKAPWHIHKYITSHMIMCNGMNVNSPHHSCEGLVIHVNASRGTHECSTPHMNAAHHTSRGGRMSPQPPTQHSIQCHTLDSSFLAGSREISTQHNWCLTSLSLSLSISLCLSLSHAPPRPRACPLTHSLIVPIQSPIHLRAQSPNDSLCSPHAHMPFTWTKRLLLFSPTLSFLPRTHRNTCSLT